MEKEKIAQLALDRCRSQGATYADVRIEKIEDENVSVSSGTVEPIEQTISHGIGIRVIKNGAWGFAATDDMSEKSIAEKAIEAVAIAEASAMVNKTPVVLAPVDAFQGQFVSPLEIDPFAISLDEKISFLMDIDKVMAEAGGETLNSRNCFAGFRRRDKYFVSSAGSLISQMLIQTGAGLSVGLTKGHRESYERSFPTSSGQYESKGFELLEELKSKDAVPQLVEEVKMLLSAEECPAKTTTLLLSGDQVSLQMHESIGHPLELDRVFGSERNFSGTSFATPENLNKLKYASDIVTVTSDPTTPHGLASYAYDDEGVAAYPADLIKNGLLVNYLSSRETAARIGLKSTAAMRANSWANIPIVRITNINLKPGDKSFEQLLSEIDDGIYMSGVRSWSIDDARRYFQFGCEIGWLIEGGKLTTPIKSPTYSGCTTDFWNKCSGIADKNSYRIWGTPNCGKGQPGQNARTAQGASPARFDHIEIGG
ncbi:MAG: peptidase C69 [candidate division Zixibacteria bacterium HGW-Zixibacteria-1]|nr:MAG: peptidase C69 [candidate division Zixibacteria bacterium HGW-Zixibacteria-1]